MDLQSAIDAPRFRHLEGLELALEPEIDGRVAADLSRRGHELASPDGLVFGGAQVVKRLDRGWAAASDPRRDGCAGGY
jgi:gamma-glutamyltranspeptidase/glutathione hydrolase